MKLSLVCLLIIMVMVIVSAIEVEDWEILLDRHIDMIKKNISDQWDDLREHGLKKIRQVFKYQESVRYAKKVEEVAERYRRRLACISLLWFLFCNFR